MTKRMQVQRAASGAALDTPVQCVPRDSYSVTSAALAGNGPFAAAPANASRDPGELPMLLTADETATLLRTSRKAIYLMAERGQLPGLTKIGRRTLFRTTALLDWLDQRSAPSPKE